MERLTREQFIERLEKGEKDFSGKWATIENDFI